MPEIQERLKKTLTNEQAKQVMRFKVVKLADSECPYCWGEGWTNTPIGLIQCLCKRHVPDEVILHWSIVMRESIDGNMPF